MNVKAWREVSFGLFIWWIQQAKSFLRDFELDRNGVFTPTPMPIESYTRAGQLVRRHTSTLGTRFLSTLCRSARIFPTACEPPVWLERRAWTPCAAVSWGWLRCLSWRPKSSAIRLACRKPGRWRLLFYDVPDNLEAMRWAGRRLLTWPRFTREWPVSDTNSCVWRLQLHCPHSCFANERLAEAGWRCIGL